MALGVGGVGRSGDGWSRGRGNAYYDSGPYWVCISARHYKVLMPKASYSFHLDWGAPRACPCRPPSLPPYPPVSPERGSSVGLPAG
jgi:hypothetical protein